MIWRPCTLAASIIFGLVTAQAEDRDPHGAEYLIYWGPARPVFLRLTLNVNGQSHRSAWKTAAERLFDAFDRNADRTVTNNEGMAQLAALVSMELMADSNANARAESMPLALRKEAMVEWLDSRGVRPLGIVNSATAPAPTNAGNEPRSVDNELLLGVLDANQSGSLSADELQLSLLPKLDLDDDECLSAREVQAAFVFAAESPSTGSVATARMPVRSAAPAVRLTSLSSSAALRQTVRDLMTRYDKNRDGLLTADELDLDPADAARFDQDANARLDLDELALLVRRSIAQCTLDCRWASGVGSTHDALILGDQAVAIELGPLPLDFDREAMLRLFSEVDADHNQYLVPAEIEAVAFLKRGFRVMDRNGDEKLFSEEFLVYAERAAMLASVQTVLTFQTQSQNVFETIDANRDGKLSRAETSAFANRISSWDSNSDSAVTVAEVSSSARFILGPAGSWTLAQGQATSRPKLLRELVWFQRMDRNRDGFVSQREFFGPLDSFVQMDANRDGQLDATEADISEGRSAAKN